MSFGDEELAKKIFSNQVILSSLLAFYLSAVWGRNHEEEFQLCKIITTGGLWEVRSRKSMIRVARFEPGVFISWKKYIARDHWKTIILIIWPSETRNYEHLKKKKNVHYYWERNRWTTAKIAAWKSLKKFSPVHSSRIAKAMTVSLRRDCLSLCDGTAKNKRERSIRSFYGKNMRRNFPIVVVTLVQTDKNHNSY